MKYLYFTLLFALSLPIFGQGADPFPASPNSSVQSAPIDGGILGLLLAGLSYGFYKFKKKWQ